MKDSQELIREIQDSVEAYLNDLMQQPRKSIVQMKNELTDYLTSLVYDNTQRRPMIIPVIMNVKRSS